MMKRPSGKSISRFAWYSQLTGPSPKCVDRFEFNSRLTCAIDEPSITGSIRPTMRRTRASPQPQRGIGIKRSLNSDGSWTANGRMTARNTAHASVYTARDPTNAEEHGNATREEYGSRSEE